MAAPEPASNLPRERQRSLSRRGFLATTGTGVVAAGMAGFDAPSATAATGHGTSAVPARRIEYTMPSLRFADSGTQASLGVLHEAALTGLIGINTIYADPSVYDKVSLVDYPPATFVRAGGGYPAPQRWTRDAAVNAWSAASLLGPLVGRNTLWSVVDPTSDGGLIVQQDDQWWDQIVWVVSAWNHYLITGDQQFLARAYQVSVNTLNARRAQNFNSSLGLFEGPGFMDDGIAGYPSPPWEPGVDSSFVLDYPHANEMMCLSTNCLYYGAYLALAGMATALGNSADAAGYRASASRLRDAVNRNLWIESAGGYGYFVHGNDQLAGQLDTSQEGGGWAFAILFGVADQRQTGLMLTNAHWQPHGIVNVWPHFARFSDQQPGRHNVMVWPMVHGMFGHAAAAGGRTDLFARAVTDLAALVNGSDQSFYELYNSETGVVDGGWQTGGDGKLDHNVSQPDQAWSATGYLRMIYYGLFGLTFGADSLRLAPTLPPAWGAVSLYGLPYRDMTLDIRLTGGGNRVSACTVDGRASQPVIPAGGTGAHTIDITLA